MLSPETSVSPTAYEATQAPGMLLGKEVKTGTNFPGLWSLFQLREIKNNIKRKFKLLILAKISEEKGEEKEK